jgi:long-chain acyl-CoA synthetase
MARQDPEHLALVAPDGTEITAGDLDSWANRIANGLRALGLQTGDAVAYVLPNGAELIALYLATMQTGLYLVPINTHLVGPEIAYIVSNSDARVFVGYERFGEACSAAAEELDFPKERRFAVGSVPGFRSFQEIELGQPDTPPGERAMGMVMNYTSGTTGRPKGVRRPLPDVDPDRAAAGFVGKLLLFDLQPGDGNVHLVGSPLYHTAVLVYGAGALQLGHTVVLMDKWSAEGMLQLIERYHVTSSHMVPTQFYRLLALPEDVKQRFDLSSLRHMIHAAAPCPIDVKRRMIEWWGPVIDEYYSSSEGGGTYVMAEEWLRKPGTVGRPWPTAEIAIFDDDGKQVTTPGQIGTVYIAGPAGNFEYYKDKEKTQKNRIGKYFTVGDMGYLDEDGWLFLCDRKSDMIISGGANIYPAEIEHVLLMHPSVRDAAVFGIPNPDWGEEVKAVVELEPGETAEGLGEDILAFCEGRLARYKRPRSIDFTNQMPRDPNGKLYKRQLRDPYWVGHERAI